MAVVGQVPGVVSCQIAVVGNVRAAVVVVNQAVAVSGQAATVVIGRAVVALPVEAVLVVAGHSVAVGALDEKEQCKFGILHK